MPVKYPEGSFSPTGKYIVRGGKWVSVREAISKRAEETAARLAPPPLPESAPKSLMDRWQESQVMRRTGGASPEVAQNIGLPGAVAASGAGLALGAGAAAPGAVLGVAKGAAAEELLRHGAKEMGLPPIVGTIVGAYGGAKAAPAKLLRQPAKEILTKVLQFILKKGVKEGGEEVGEAGLSAGARAAAPEAAKIMEKVYQWKNVNKFSDGQIINALREQFGRSAKEAKMILSLFAGGG